MKTFPITKDNHKNEVNPKMADIHQNVNNPKKEGGPKKKNYETYNNKLKETSFCK